MGWEMISNASGPLSSRREVVMGMLGTAAAATLPFAAEAADASTLKALADRKGLLFGSAISAHQLGLLPGTTPDLRYQTLITTQCSVVVPENEFKMHSLLREPGEDYDFAPADALVSFARQNKIRMRGHTLLWNKTRYIPKWLTEHDFGASPKRETERFLRDYIARVCDHFGDFIISWDVINETLDPSTGKLWDTPFSRNLGFDALRIAYETAHEHAPRAQLVYNDYISWYPYDKIHRTALLKLLADFRKNRVPVHALGIQSHIGHTPIDPHSRKEWLAFLDAVVAMGYRLLITEFDVSDFGLPTNFRERDASIAAVARDYLDMMLSYRQLDQLLCWGLVDKYSWMQWMGTRSDKTSQRPDPYDDEYRPKPIRDAIAAAIRAAPKRQKPGI